VRRFFRHLFPLLSGVSLLLCVAVCVLWMRSWTAFDEFYEITWNGSTGRYSERGVAWDRGRLLIVYRWTDLPMGQNYTQLRLPAPMSRHRVKPNSSGEHELPWWHVDFGGAGIGRGSVNGVFGRSYLVGMVLWPVILLTMILPAVWLFRAYRNRKRRAKDSGCCAICGYDLRASPSRCPECGRVLC
jgi:hypothetical protein